MQCIRDFVNRDLLTLEVEGRRARDHPQVGTARQVIDQLLRQAIREVLLIVLLADVHEGQHGDRLVVGRRDLCIREIGKIEIRNRRTFGARQGCADVGNRYGDKDGGGRSPGRFYLMPEYELGEPVGKVTGSRLDRIATQVAP